MRWIAALISLCIFHLQCVAALTKACQYKPADIIFVVDGSGSEGSSNFRKQLMFINNFTNQFEIGPNATQVSLLSFGTSVKNQFYLNTYKTGHDIANAVMHAHYPNGETYTHLALDHVRRQNLLTAHGARPSVPKLVILMTDGRSTEPTLTLEQAALLKRMPDVTVMVIGVGNGVDQHELYRIATDRNHTFYVASFDALHTVQTDLTDKTCKVCDGAADIYFLLDSSGSEGRTNFDKQLQFTALVAGEFDIGPQNTRIGVATFSTTGRNEIGLSTYSDKSALLQNIMKVRYHNGESNTHLGLQVIKTEMSSHDSHTHGQTTLPNRTGARKYCIVLTDGNSLEPTLTLKYAIELHRMGVETFVVGIGNNIDKYELIGIATNSKHVFTVQNFDMLGSIHQQLVDEICGQSSITTTPLATTLTTTRKTTTKPTTPTTTTRKTTTRPTTPTTTLTTTTTKTVCGTKPADILFILDSSDSESEENFQKMLDFARSFAAQFTISKYNVLFSVLTFSSNVTNQFFFNTYHTRHDILDAIKKTPYLGTGTSTDVALKFAHEQSFLPANGARANSTKIAIVITDGNSFNPNATQYEAALLHKLAQVFSIGIGPSVDQSELQHIASSPHNVVKVNNFELLHNIRKQLTDTACSRHK